MAKRMLVDATHPEETRVVVVNGNRLEELDFEIASRKQLKGNIYLARVIRVEPSLQAAFVEYGGNRHGFLAFSEIHPDYYRIPVADREALLREQQELAEEREARAMERAETETDGETPIEQEPPLPAPEDVGGGAPALIVGEEGNGDASGVDSDGVEPGISGDADGETGEVIDPTAGEAGDGSPFVHSSGRDNRRRRPRPGPRPVAAAVEAPEQVEEEVEPEEPRQARRRPMKSYKIQEVIKRRQILLVQVTKEERGNKGAALTTFLSLPGRYAVLMPNTPRGGGISRKITNPADRKRLKEMLEDFDIPSGMSVILRTAGIERSKPEIRRDLEYLMRLWDSIRETTLQSVAPALIYEEANLIKRTIRDLYSSDIDEVHVEGEAGYQVAKDFMRMLMPSHAKKIQLYQDEGIPLFHRFQVEGAIETMFNPIVQLKSGGYIVINQTEALVAIDVNSGRSTKERNIEETAVRTNLEAAEEVARQLRLRDLAGLIVIDFIDMEDPRNNASVEKRLKDCMKADRARIQLGRISAFGLLELSRQRLRPSLQEINFERCPHCQGTGMIRSLESAALAILRAVEEEGIRKRSAEITVTCASAVTLYILNHKREALADIERRHGLRVYLQADDHLTGTDHRLERLRARLASDDIAVAPVSAERVMAQTERAMEAEEAEVEEVVPVEPEEEEVEAPAPVQNGHRGEGNGDRDRDGRRRRRRRRRRGERGEGTGTDANGDQSDDAEGEDEADQEADTAEIPAAAADPIVEAEAVEPAGEETEDEADEAAAAGEDEAAQKKRRRGKRGGRRRGRRGDELSADGESDEEGAEEAAAPVTAEVPTVEPVVTAPVEPVAEAAPTVAAPVEAPAAVEPVAEEAAAPKKRATRSRKKVAEPAVEAPVVVEAPVEAPAAVEPVAEEAAAPKKRATRSRKKVADAVTEAPVVTEVPVEAPVAVEPVAEEAAAPKKKAPPRSRKKVAEPVAAEVPAAEQVSEPVPPAPVVEPAPVATPAPESAAEPATEKPRRGGWWSRKA
ncbi:ribonuclease E/G [Niveispirillum sp. BGYR6]|uniref:ribonuclease E/G n=1 Tax=Niveispirillum sp. BGYR6 TaxID=2971249 RepID=UPI0022B9C25D|nr:ribonuclease E/G [Niveispirillum sp. BGYR6]MDG5494590.1 Rne/Rng family ribonuclease [Niveispirillum sp. BGYR6]